MHHFSLNLMEDCLSRQERSRSSQRRYRAKVADKVKALEDSVRQLTLDNLRLEGRHRMIRSTTAVPRPIDSFCCLLLAREYFSVARFGIVPGTTIVTEALARLVDPDVKVQNICGRNAFFQHWRRYSTYFGALEMHCEAMTGVPLDTGHVVHCSGFINLRLTSVSIVRIFPHLLGDKPLVQRLVGQDIRAPFVFSLEFTEDGTRIAAFRGDVGFTVAIMELLRSSSDASTVMAGARIESSLLQS
ncbi:hypothetical protein ACHHYP_00231 [Achlya hypogyna]|uniref:Bzip transcription factor n=1 Tax=Achlya hypogyna TaxID=1202772 RepID=A0A1V9ZB27_ACHHY|nr:hypothetical protein ACHHYP_00231 [Achlya hypogyna]